MNHIIDKNILTFINDYKKYHTIKNRSNHQKTRFSKNLENDKFEGPLLIKLIENFFYNKQLCEYIFDHYFDSSLKKFKNVVEQKAVKKSSKGICFNQDNYETLLSIVLKNHLNIKESQIKKILELCDYEQVDNLLAKSLYYNNEPFVIDILFEDFFKKYANKKEKSALDYVNDIAYNNFLLNKLKLPFGGNNFLEEKKSNPLFFQLVRFDKGQVVAPESFKIHNVLSKIEDKNLTTMLLSYLSSYQNDIFFSFRLFFMDNSQLIQTLEPIKFSLEKNLLSQPIELLKIYNLQTKIAQQAPDFFDKSFEQELIKKMIELNQEDFQKRLKNDPSLLAKVEHYQLNKALNCTKTNNNNINNADHIKLLKKSGSFKI